MRMVEVLSRINLPSNVPSDEEKPHIVGWNLFNTRVTLLTAGSQNYFKLQPRKELKGGGELLSFPEWSGLR